MMGRRSTSGVMFNRQQNDEMCNKLAHVIFYRRCVEIMFCLGSSYYIIAIKSYLEINSINYYRRLRGYNDSQS